MFGKLAHFFGKISPYHLGLALPHGLTQIYTKLFVTSTHQFYHDEVVIPAK